ncbi:hypothetical protein NDU88_007692 [Pleurodeles waltl]|uniref:Uncharacterized protein n=1 Tax=Pleurodeles waltl TaxID=8319 RepID=A0AAV7N4D6_PLEWA|nr:hypothetical protein NDU88_007692 [Pleurodeles waltl]
MIYAAGDTKAGDHRTGGERKGGWRNKERLPDETRWEGGAETGAEGKPQDKPKDRTESLGPELPTFPCSPGSREVEDAKANNAEA